MMKKRISPISAILVLLAVILLLAACSGGEKDGKTNQTGGGKAEGSKEKWVIRYDPQAHMPREATADNPKARNVLNELVAEYMALRDDVEIELVELPQGTDRSQWLQARMMAKDAPDVFWLNFDLTWDHYQKGWFLPLDEWLDQPNSYNGDQKWADTFMPNILDTVRAPDGQLYVIPADGVGVAIYYNRDMFEEAGLDVPQTWSEFMNVQAALAETGVIPFAGMVDSGCCDAPWIDTLVHSQLLLGQDISDIDKNGNNMVEMYEIAPAVHNGLLPNRELLKQEWELIKSWTKYWPRGFTATYDKMEMFSSQQAAMIFGGSWTIGELEAMDLDFEYGTMHFPVIESSDAPMASGIGTKIYGPWGAAQWIIPGYLQETDPDKIPVIIDWLKFLSKPDNISRLAKEGNTEPNIMGAEPPEGHDTFHEERHLTIIQHYQGFLGPSFSDKFGSSLQLYLADTMTIDQFLDEVEDYYKESAAELIRQNPQWLE